MRRRPSREKVLMDMAMSQAQRSTCERAQVGVVIARDGRVLVTGYNGAPAGLPHCDHRGDDTEDLRAGTGDGSLISRVPVSPGCQISVHAEANAVAYAARYGVALHDSELYTTYSPCLACAQIIINAGITRVIALKEYRLKEGSDLVIAAGLSMDFFGDMR